jgi:hypothetical protein
MATRGGSVGHRPGERLHATPLMGWLNLLGHELAGAGSAIGVTGIDSTGICRSDPQILFRPDDLSSSWETCFGNRAVRLAGLLGNVPMHLKSRLWGYTIGSFIGISAQFPIAASDEAPERQACSLAACPRAYAR